MSEKNGPSRRQFALTLTALGGAALLPRRVLAAGAAAGKTKVILVRDAAVLDDKGKPKPEVVLKMLDDAVAALTGKQGQNRMDAWKVIVQPKDVVGIKTNRWTYLPTTEAVETAIKQRVFDVGVKAQDVAIDDRGVLGNPVFQRATALINARPMRAHHWSGVGSLIKNYIMFSPNPSSWHADSCADLAGVWSLPIVKGKTRLNVLVMLTPQFHGVGPHNFNPKYVWRYYGLVVGFDPVACDSVGLRIIEAKRRAFFGEERPLAPPAKHIALADTRHHLGTADPSKIELVRIGYDKDSLI
jgi:citrate lyase gamma subunit